MARVVERRRGYIYFKMWGPTVVYSITAHEAGAKRENGQPYVGDYLGCSATARYTLDGEDWQRGNDYPDGPFNRATWDRIARAIRCDAIRTLPEENESAWLFMTKGTTRDVIAAKMSISFSPTLKGAADAIRRKKAAKKGAKVKTKAGATKVVLNKKKPKAKKPGRRKAQKRVR